MRLLALFLATLLAPGGAVCAAPLEIEHAKGTTTLDAAPARTVVFDLAVLDNMHALGVEAAAVPDARFPVHLAHYADDRYPKVGSLFEPDLEAVRALEPDLIIVGDRSSPAFEALSAIAPTIDLTPATDSFFEDVVGGIHALGRIHGREEQARALADELEGLRGEVMRAAHEQDAVMLFALNGNASPHAPGARFGTPLDALGIDSALPPLETPWVRTADTRSARPRPGSPEAERNRVAQALALEAAMALQPDWLIVLDRGLTTAGADARATDLSAIPVVAATEAWRAGRVFELEPSDWYLSAGSARVLRDTLQRFADRLAAEK